MPARRARGRRDRCARQQRPRAVRPGARRAGARGPRRGPAGGDGLALRRHAGHPAQGRRHAVPASTRRSPGRGRRAGCTAPPARPARVPWTDGGLPSDGVPADPELGRVVLPEAGERAALARWRAFVGDGVAGYARTRNAPAADGTSGMSVHLKYGTVHPRTLHASLDGDDVGEGGQQARRRAGLARLLRRRALAQPAVGAHGAAAAHGRARVRRGTRGRPPLRALGDRHDRLPDRRRRDAAAAGRGLRPQPGADDRRVVPVQGPAPALAPRRPPLHAAPARRRPREQLSTAGSGSPAPARTRRRTSASSTRSSRAASTTRTASTSAGGCPSCASWAPSTCTSRGGCPAGHPPGTRCRSSTTPPSGPRRCGATPP